MGILGLKSHKLRSFYQQVLILANISYLVQSSTNKVQLLLTNTLYGECIDGPRINS